jgi:hypothetical protein
MRTCDDLTLGRRALQLFSVTYLLTWTDSFAAAHYERTNDPDRTARVLALISKSGCSFDQAAQAVAAIDAAVREVA